MGVLHGMLCRKDGGMVMVVHRVYLARHGQTEWNLARRRQGQLDSPLTADGLAQARANAARLEGRGIDTIFTSPLGRAMDTANIIAEVLCRPVVAITDLAEVNHGYCAGLTNDEIRHEYPGALEFRSRDKFEWRFPGGESYADADIRAAHALDLIAAHAPKRPLLVSHEMIGRMLLRRLAGLAVDEALATNQPHDVIYEIDPIGASMERLCADPRHDESLGPPHIN
jgi:broad specificity phosphatase PhoE